MEKQEKRISRVERHRKKYKGDKKEKHYSEKRKIIIESTDYSISDDDCINSSKERVRRTERNKKKRRRGFFTGKIKNKEADIPKEKDLHMKIAAFILIFIGLLIIAGGFSLYFKSHFYFGTAINCLNVSGKSVEDVEEEFKTNIVDYNLKLIGRNDTFEEIKGSEIDLNYDESRKNEIQQIKNEQNKLSWFKALFSEKENGISQDFNYISSIVSYSQEKLVRLLDNLDMVKDKNISQPKNACLKYEGNSFVIEKEEQGNKINKDKLYDEIVKSISSGISELNLDKADCYEKPEYTSSSEEVISAENKLNQYKDLKITYVLGKDNEEISGSKLLDFFEFDDDFNCKFSDDKVSAYVDDLCKKYNTYGSHKFTTTDGNSIIVNGGDYGYEINKDGEIRQIKEDIEGKKPISRKPVYSKTALGDITDDIGNTYVEINMSKQHLWFYKNGTLITQGDVVTGNVGNGTATPEGVYSLKYKAKDSVLVGEGYRSPVSFWMPFNNNIGIHDASWRSVFGGKIYLSSGSHGCVNAPYILAQAIYSNIESGTPVICYN